MVRTRLAVALLVPPPVASEVDGVRRALGDRRRTRIAPHVTLVPPVNMPADRVVDAVSVLQDAAQALGPLGSLRLELGPVASFGADSGIVYLAVGGAPHHNDALRGLRDSLRLGPFAREDRHEFVPHVTVADRLPPDAVADATALLAGFRTEITIDRVHLLEHRHDGGGSRWEAIADARFAEPAVVGRGGLELELVTAGLIDPVARTLIELATRATGDDVVAEDGAGSGGGPAGPDVVERFRAEVPRGAEPVVVTARRRRTTVGVAWGWGHPTLAGEVLAVVVAPDARHQGVGGHLRRRVEAHLAATDGGPEHPGA